MFHLNSYKLFIKFSENPNVRNKLPSSFIKHSPAVSRLTYSQTPHLFLNTTFPFTSPKTPRKVQGKEKKPPDPFH